MTARDWYVVDSGPGTAGFNMALDEALLETAASLQRPILRFYGWSEPAATFGYFQKYREVEKLTSLRPLVRRPTGGGIVPHDCDWTYSLAFPSTHEWFAIKAIESYRRIHTWIQLAFALLQLKSELAPETPPAPPGQCFVGFTQYDLLSNQKKIAGAAQRRRRDGLLIQGSVQPPEKSISRKDWQKAMCSAGEEQYETRWRIWIPAAEVLSRADELVRAKYSAASYNQRR